MDMFENPTLDMGYSGETKGMMRDHVDPKPASHIVSTDTTENEASNIFNAVGKSISESNSAGIVGATAGTSILTSTMALLASNEEAPNEATTHNITAKRNITTGEYSYNINTPQTVNSSNNNKMMLYFGAALAVILITQM